MILKLILTTIHINACSILNVMEVARLDIISNSQSFDVKLCAVAIHG